MKRCIMDDKICDNCYECDICDLNLDRICDNCEKCLGEFDYKGIEIDDILVEIEPRKV